MKDAGYYPRNENPKKSRREYNKAWRQSHPESVRRSNRKQYWKNRAKRAAYNKQYRQQHLEIIKQRMREYHKKTYQLKRERLIEQTTTYAKSHPEVRRLVAINYKRRHPERVKSQRSACAHRRKARLKSCQVGGPEVTRLIKQWKSEPSFTCSYCGETFLIPELHVDHINPLSRGGSHTVENICRACGPCNRKKRDKWTETACWMFRAKTQ